MTDIEKRVNLWLETWAPNCGAPASVFVGQFRSLMGDMLNALERETYKRGVYAFADLRKQLGIEEP